MVIVDKQTLIHWMLLDSLSKESHYLEKISIFKNKYKTDFITFKNRIETSEKESFEEWDAYEGFLAGIQERVNDIRNGNIQLAG